MCGRFAQRLPSHLLMNLYETRPFMANVPPNYNVAPTQTAMVVRAATEDLDREIALPKWGLIPWFSETGKMDKPTFNARCETVASSPMFREAYKSRRCIVPADAFYEWKKLGEGPKPLKQPYAIGRADGEPLVLAGLWETWKPKDGGEPVRSFTIITTTANATMAEIYNRMPVILAPDDVPVWLGEERGDPSALMRPCPAEWLKVWKVSARVGNVKNNDEGLLDEQ